MKWVERSALRSAVKTWLHDPNAARILLLIGSPGSGKSTFCESLVESDDPPVDAAHFCRIHDASSTGPLAVVSALSAQLAQNVPGFAQELLKDHSARSSVNVTRAAAFEVPVLMAGGVVFGECCCTQSRSHLIKA